MFKVKFMYSDFPSATLFKFFKSKVEANLFIRDIGNRFISIEEV
jgi:hypothetical protein